MELFKLLGTVAVDIDEAKKNLDDITQKAEKTGSNLGSSLQTAGKKMSSVGTALMPITGTLGGIAVASGTMSMSFEDAMAKVSTIADDTKVPIKDMETAILELSKQSGVSANDIAENVYNAISAGQETGDAVNFVSKATTLARAGFAETGDALDLMTTIMNAYGLEAEEVTHVSDALITTQNLGKTTVAELSSAMGKAIPTAKSVGVNLDTLCGAYAVMTSNGIATAETTTYLNSMLNELGKEGTTASNAFRAGTEHIKEGGLSMKEAMDMGWDLTDVLSILDEQAFESGTSINNMFGSAEAGKSALVLWDNAQKLNSSVEAMGESAGATQIAYDKLDTSSFNLKKTWNEVKNTGIELGNTIMETLAPYIEKASKKVHELCEWFSNLDEDQKKNILTIGAVVAGIAPALIVFGKVFTAIGAIITVVTKIKVLFTALAPIIGGISAPVLIVIGVIGALVAIGVALYKNWDKIKEGAENLKNAIGKTWNSVKEQTSQAWENVKQKTTDAWNKVKDSMTSTVESAKNLVSRKLDAIKQKYEENGGGIKGVVSAGMEAVKQYYSIGFNAINTLTGGQLGKMVDKFKDKFEEAKQKVKDAIEKIKSFFKFEWSLPKLKMPHFKLEGEFSLKPPSVPTIGVDWYAKAMDDPMIMNQPTAFGINANGQIMAGGEAGSEIVSGTNTLMNMISTAVSAQNQGLENKLSGILEMMAEYMPQMANMQIVTDTGALVGAIAPQMDRELGRRATRSGRGV